MAGVALADGVTAGAINDSFTGLSVTTDGTTGFNVTYDSGVPDSAGGADAANTAIETFLATDVDVTSTATTRPAVTADASSFDGTNVNSTAAATFADAVNALGSFSGAVAGDIEADTTAAELQGGLNAVAGVTVAESNGELSFTFDNTVTDEDAAAFMEAVQISGYSRTEANLSFTDTASTEAVLSAAAQSAEATTVDMQMGVNSSSVQFAGSAAGVGAMSTDAAYTQVYVDFDDELTTTEEVTTTYNVDPNSAEVSIVSSDGEGKYAQEAGAAVYINDQGRLTSEETSAGERTEDPLAALDAALAQVDGLRSDLGAIQNRFESAITNLSTNETNLSAARSRIEDADYATEVANMTRAQILQQAGTSVLAQANQIPQNVLSLLG